MVRIKHLAVLCALVASPLAAQPGLPMESPHLATASGIAALPATPQLYVAARPEHLDGHRVLSFEVRLNGRVHLWESVFLDTVATEGNAFEILAARPDLRAHLVRMAAQRGNRLEIRLLVDQEVIRRFPTWEAFLLYNQKLQAGGIQPRQVFSTVLDPSNPEGGVRNLTAKGVQQDPNCLNQCYLQYTECLNWGGSGCESQYETCVGSCPYVCVEPRSQTTSTTYGSWIGPSYTGNSGCYKPFPNWQGYIYSEMVKSRQNTTTTTTTACNYTTSTSSYQWTETKYCWSSTPLTCGSQTLWAPTCNF